MMASRTGNVAAMKVLLDRGAQVNAKETLRGTTALMWAADQGTRGRRQAAASTAARTSNARSNPAIPRQHRVSRESERSREDRTGRSPPRRRARRLRRSRGSASKDNRQFAAAQPEARADATAALNRSRQRGRAGQPGGRRRQHAQAAGQQGGGCGSAGTTI